MSRWNWLRRAQRADGRDARALEQASRTRSSGAKKADEPIFRLEPFEKRLFIGGMVMPTVGGLAYATQVAAAWHEASHARTAAAEPAAQASPTRHPPGATLGDSTRFAHRRSTGASRWLELSAGASGVASYLDATADIGFVGGDATDAMNWGGGAFLSAPQHLSDHPSTAISPILAEVELPDRHRRDTFAHVGRSGPRYFPSLSSSITPTSAPPTPDTTSTPEFRTTTTSDPTTFVSTTNAGGPGAESLSIPVSFHGAANDWTFGESGGSDPGRGSAGFSDGAVTLTEGNSFLVSVERTFVIPDGFIDPTDEDVPEKGPFLVFGYPDFSFDPADADNGTLINDAFEVALLDAEGVSLVPTIGEGRDTFFNATEIEGATSIVSGEGVVVDPDAGIVRLDVSGITGGTAANLVFRLINNDQDQATQVMVAGIGVPSPSISGAATVTEGSTYTLNLSASGPGSESITEWSVDWGDGSSSTVPASATTATHVYADGDRTYVIRASATNPGGTYTSNEQSVLVANVAPTLSANWDHAIVSSVGSASLVFNVSGTFTDPGFTRASAGTAETFTVAVDWGDGTIDEITPSVTQGSPGTLSSGSFSAGHTYTTGGVFTATVTVRDDDGGVDSANFTQAVARIDVMPIVNTDLAHLPDIPVMIFSDPGFDALTVDPASLRFGPDEAAVSETPPHLHPNDGDALVHFDLLETGFLQNDPLGTLTGTPAVLTGTVGGISFIGIDMLSVVSEAEAFGSAKPMGSGTKFYVVDPGVDTVFRYAPNGSSNGSATLNASLTPNARGIASNATGTVQWVVDATTKRVAVHSSTGVLLGSWIASDLQQPEGITTDGVNIWIVDAAQDKVLFYAGGAALLLGSWTATSSFSLHADNGSASDLVTDGTTMWVVDDAADDVFVYDLTGGLIGRWDLDAANADASGVALDPTNATNHLWVLDRVDKRVYRYADARARRTGTAAFTDSFRLNSANTSPEGIADPPETYIDSKGTEFWLSFPNETMYPILFVTAEESATVTVTVPSTETTLTQFVTENGTVVFDLTQYYFNSWHESDSVSNQSIHVEATREVSLYGWSSLYATIAESTDGFLALPTDALGTSYVVSSYTTPTDVYGWEVGSWFTVVATIPNTTVTITPKVTVGSRAANTPYDIQLTDAGQVYMLHDRFGFQDLTGTVIEATQPIAVFSGHDLAYVPADAPWADYLIEQLAPVSTWGTEFVTMPLATRTKGDTFRFFAAEPDTTIVVDGVALPILGRGDFHEQIFNTAGPDVPHHITSNKPIQVVQYANGQSYDGVMGDPFMMLVPPIANFVEYYVFTAPTPADVYFSFQHYVAIVAPADAVGDIELDGVAIPAASFVPIQDSGYWGATLPVAGGNHILSGRQANGTRYDFGVFLYGWGGAISGYYGDHSYGFPGGMRFAAVPAPVGLQLTPRGAVLAPGDQHTVDATVIDRRGQPLAGVTVEFLVTGANAATGSAVTDENGVASFSYFGRFNGTDTIRASVGPITDTAIAVFHGAVDTSASSRPIYGRTSFDKATDVLHTELAIQNIGNHWMDGPLYVAVKNISDASVTVDNPDGYTSEGLPYFDFTSLIGGDGRLTPDLSGGSNGEQSDFRTISFHNPQGVRFEYELVVLAQPNVPPVFSTQPITTAEPGIQYEYDADATDLNSGDEVTYAVIAGPRDTSVPMVVDATTGVVTWTPTSSEQGSYTVILRATDSRGAFTDQVYVLKVMDPSATDRPPVITSQPVLHARANEPSHPYRYQVRVYDPDGDAITFGLLNAPAGMKFGPADGLPEGMIEWVPTIAQAGQSYPITVIASTGSVGAMQSFEIDVQINEPPVIQPVPNQTATAGALFRYDLKASDPNGDRITFKLDAGPAGMAVDHFGRISWIPTEDDITDGANPPHTVTVTASDPYGATASRTFSITVQADTEAPTVKLAISRNPSAVGDVTFYVYASDNVAVAQRTLTIGSTTYTIEEPDGSLSLPLTAGTYSVTASATDTSGNQATTPSQTLNVVNDNSHPIANITDPQALPSSDPEAAQLLEPLPNVSGRVEVKGTANDPDGNFASYSLRISGPSGSFAADILNPNAPVVNGVLGYIDTTLLTNDVYTITLTVRDSVGKISTASVDVAVTNEAKVGNFRFAETDLVVPVSGIPLTLTRRYDTLNRGRFKDFGYGWEMELALGFAEEPEARTSYPLQAGADPGTGSISIRSGGSRDVWLTLPGGRRTRFEFQLVGALNDPQRWEAIWVPEPDVHATLIPTDADGFPIDNRVNKGSIFVGPFWETQPARQGDFTQQPDARLFHAFDIPGYLLTLEDGTKFHIGKTERPATRDGGRRFYDWNGNPDDQAFSYVDHIYYPDAHLRKIVDTNGNVVEFKKDGLFHTDGLALGFTRDALGRVTSVQDAAGQTVLEYAYDAQGDLTSVTRLIESATATNPARKATTTYTYKKLGGASTHIVEKITSPTGKTPIINHYDERGRLTKTVDAFGKKIIYDHDLANRQEIVTDRLGQQTVYVYDDNGDVTRVTNANGEVTDYTYANRRVTTETVYETTGATGTPFTKTYTYDAKGFRTSESYSVGGDTIVSRWVYADAAGKHVLIAAVDPAGVTTEHLYDSRANVTETRLRAKDPDNGSDGDYTDGPILQRTTYDAYDGRGNPTSITRYNTNELGLLVPYVATVNVYDAAGRLVETREEKPAAVPTDPPILLAKSTFTYDANGNQLTSTQWNKNAAGVWVPYATTRTDYDRQNRPVKTAAPLGAVTQTIYNDDGQIFKTIDADEKETISEYDSLGQLFKTTDRLGNSTFYRYDAGGNVVQTEYPDGTVTRTVYDSLGRPQYVVDRYKPAAPDTGAHGTRTIYDARGRVEETRRISALVIEVLPDPAAPGLFTSHVASQGSVLSTSSSDYDIAGRITNSTGPDGQTTSYEYDSAGRQKAVVQPEVDDAKTGTRLRPRTEYDYDELGRQEIVTDAYGRNTKFSYDRLGRHVRTDFLYNPSTGTSHSFITTSFDELGRKTGEADQLGLTTSFHYDPLGRLTAVEQPPVDDPEDSSTALVRPRYEYEYDLQGNLLVQRDAKGRQTTFTYDNQGRRLSRTLPEVIGQPTGCTASIQGRSNISSLRCRLDAPLRFSSLRRAIVPSNGGRFSKWLTNSMRASAVGPMFRSSRWDGKMRWPKLAGVFRASLTVILMNAMSSCSLCGAGGGSTPLMQRRFHLTRKRSFIAEWNPADLRLLQRHRSGADGRPWRTTEEGVGVQARS